MRRAGIACLALAATLISGCGITAGPVRPQGRPQPAAAAGTEAEPEMQRQPQMDHPVALVTAFLAAPAVDDPAKRATTLKSFIVPGEAWQPGSDINVVRVVKLDLRGTSDGTSTQVDVTIQHLGTFINGAIEAPTRSTEVVTYTAVSLAGKGMYLKPPPLDIYLSEAGLDGYYQARPLYFDTENADVLVPDLRYVPRHFLDDRKAERMVQLLYSGAAGWLRQAVRPISADTRPEGRATLDSDGVVTIDLAKPVSNEEYQRLYRLLAKTLIVDPVNGLKVTMQSQPGPVPNVVAPEQERASSGRMVVVNGSVVRLRDGMVPPDTSVGLSPEVNQNVVAAAFSRHGDAALVAQQDGERLKLMVGRRPGLLKVEGLRPRKVGQPVWITKGTTVAMLLADGKIYQISVTGVVTEVQGVPDNVTSMSVAPDGVRVALVVNGGVRLGALKRAGSAVSLTTTAAVPSGLLGEVHNVAFGRPAAHELYVAGTEGTAVRIMLMKLDGSQQQVFNRGDTWLSPLRINHLSVDPLSSRVLIEVNPLGSFEAQTTASVNLQQNATATASATPGADLKPKVTAPSFEI